MLNMKTATVRQIQHHFKDVLSWIKDGEEVEVTSHRRTVARLLPVRTNTRKQEWPDFEARLKKTFPRGIKGKPLSEIIDEQRGDRP